MYSLCELILVSGKLCAWCNKIHFLIRISFHSVTIPSSDFNLWKFNQFFFFDSVSSSHQTKFRLPFVPQFVILIFSISGLFNLENHKYCQIKLERILIKYIAHFGSIFIIEID